MAGVVVQTINPGLGLETNFKEEDLVWLDVRDQPFQVYGLCDNGRDAGYSRIPPEIARETDYPGGFDTAGGRVRLATDSAYIALKAVMPTVTRFVHMTLCASSGFDLYLDNGPTSTYFGTFYPPIDMVNGYEAVFRFREKKMRSLTINFPLYNRVDKLYIGLQGSAMLSGGLAYDGQKPLVFYGSSITQGGCASRPGNAYPAMIARRLNRDYINLGFSGRARGEGSMADYIASLSMSAFIDDYDYNAPDEAHLSATHQRFFQIIRERQPDLPVIFVSRPNFDSEPQYLDPAPAAAARRRDIVYRTYIQAFQAGDDQVYYVDGLSLFGGEGRDCCTVDATHPNDLGFWRMADIIGQAVRLALNHTK